MTLYIPDLDPEADTCAAALAYADAGWYVLPVKTSTKHPGSVLGKGWPAKSSRDPKQIVAWFAGSGDGLALHCGRSGAVAFDVDKPEAIPAALADEVERAKPPAQASRRDNDERAHYLFMQPEGRSIGNGGGGLGTAWGEVRGRNGIIVVAPTPHAKPDGLYRWLHTGPVPVLGAGVADLLPDQAGTEDAATDVEIDAFLARYTTADRPELLEGVANSLRTDLERGGGRHPSAVTAVCWALREAQAGMYDARAALAVLWPVFRDALRDEPGRSPAAEWRGIVAWAIGQAALDDPAATRERLTAAEPFGEAAEASAPGQPASRAEQMRARLHDRDGLDSLPPPEPLIRGVLDVGTMAVLAGKFGSYKSFISIGWACSVATGRPWLDEFEVTRAGPVLYVAAEGASGLRKRIRAWEIAHNDGERISSEMFHALDMTVRINDAADRAAFMEIVAEIAPTLVVVDTLHRCTPGLDENSNADMGLVTHFAGQIREAAGAVTLFDHHTGHQGERSRGASSIEDDSDTSWVVKLESEDRGLDTVRTLIHRKAKDDELTSEIDLALKLIEGTDSGVLERAEIVSDETGPHWLVANALAGKLAEAGLPRGATQRATADKLRELDERHSSEIIRAVWRLRGGKERRAK